MSHVYGLNSKGGGSPKRGSWKNLSLTATPDTILVIPDSKSISSKSRTPSHPNGADSKDGKFPLLKIILFTVATQDTTSNAHNIADGLVLCHSIRVYQVRRCRLVAGIANNIRFSAKS